MGESRVHSLRPTEENVVGRIGARCRIVGGKPFQCIRVLLVDLETLDFKADGFAAVVGCEDKFPALMVPSPSAFWVWVNWWNAINSDVT
jgi:hypothetical protein